VTFEIYLEIWIVGLMVAGIATFLVVKRIKGDYDIGSRFKK